MSSLGNASLVRERSVVIAFCALHFGKQGTRGQGSEGAREREDRERGSKEAIHCGGHKPSLCAAEESEKTRGEEQVAGNGGRWVVRFGPASVLSSCCVIDNSPLYPYRFWAKVFISNHTGSWYVRLND